MAVKPWKGQVAASIPSNFKEPPNGNTAPDVNLKLN